MSEAVDIYSMEGEFPGQDQYPGADIEGVATEPSIDDLDSVEEDGSNQPEIAVETVAEEIPNDLLGLYFESISRTELIDADEEVRLAKAMEKGHEAKSKLDEDAALDPTEHETLVQSIEEGQRAREEFIVANLRLVIKEANEFNKRTHIGFDELIQEGNAGLIRAVEKFDWRRGFKFSTYATWWVRQAMQRGIANNKRTIRLPQQLHDAVTKIDAARKRLEDETGQTPTVSELAKAAKLKEDTVRRASTAEKKTVSYNKPVGGEEGGDELFDLVAVSDNDTEKEAIDAVYTDAALESLRESVDERTWRIVVRHYGIGGGSPQTHEQIAEFEGVCRETIRKWILQGIETIREEVPDSVRDDTV